MKNMTEKELVGLVQTVFPPLPHDRVLGVLVDLPRNEKEDNPDWQKRRQIAKQWQRMLLNHLEDLNLKAIVLYAYPRVEKNNANLPDHITLIEGELPDTSSDLDRAGKKTTLHQMFSKTQLFLAPTEYSTTAPLKVAAQKYHFRAATMPGFNERMVPALRLNYEEINHRLQILKEKLDAAVSAVIHFIVEGHERYELVIDLRFRKATVSGGRFSTAGQVGNLPSGETYIVPYEGELHDTSRSEGILPVQFKDEVVLFRIAKNRARAVISQSKESQAQRKQLEEEPAYGNLAELGFGILRDFGIKPINEILLDEKLGLHIGFGRSDHFGGAVGEGHFSSAEAMIHIDRIYIPECQPKISIHMLALNYEHNQSEIIIKDDDYTIFRTLLNKNDKS